MVEKVDGVEIEISGDLSEYEQALRKALSATRRAATGMVRSLDRIGRKARQIGDTLKTRLTLPLVLLGTVAVVAAGRFEQSMLRVQAVTQATGDEFEALRDLAKELGETTEFSASQAAEGMAFMGQAGLDAATIFRAMPDALKLASAAQIDLGTTADLVTNILAGFRLPIEDLSKAVDILVETTNRSNTDLRQLAEAFKLAGPIARAAGLSFAETAAALGVMANAGFQATLGGTALRGAMIRVLNPTKEAADAMRRVGLSLVDSNGRLLEMTEIVRRLAPFVEDVGLLATVFGQRAGPGMAALVGQGIEELENLQLALENAGGTAARVAEIRMRGLFGAFKLVRSGAEAFVIAMGDAGVLGAIEDFARSLAQTFRALATLRPELLKFAAIFLAVAAAAGPVLIIFGLMATGAVALAAAIKGLAVLIGVVLVGAFKALIGVLRVAVGLIAFLVTPLGAALVAATAVATAFKVFGRTVDIVARGIKDAIVNFISNTISNMVQRAKRLFAQFINAAIEVRNAVTELFGGDPIELLIVPELDLEETDFAGDIAAAMAEAREQAALDAEAFLDVMRNLKDRVGEIFGTFVPDLDNLFTSGEEGAAAFRDALEEIAAAFENVGEAGVNANNAITEAEEARGDVADAAAARTARAIADFEDLGDVARNVTNTIINLIKQILIVEPLTAALRGGFRSLIGAPSVPTSGSAGGGTIFGGVPELVGERGPELFIPRTSGSVVNGAGTRRALGQRMGDVNMTNVFTAPVQKDMFGVVFAATPLIKQATIEAMNTQLKGQTF